MVEKGASILEKEDEDVANRVRELLSSEGIEVHTASGDRIKNLRFDEVFIASGRRGNIENLGLEEAGVKTDKTYIVADKYLQTSVPRIWACGDVHGQLQFTHVAAYEAVKLVRNMLFPGRSAVAYSHVPWALYTVPEGDH